MSRKTSPYLIAAAAALVLVGACSKKGSSSTTIDDFVSGVQATDGTTASFQSRGAAPSANSTGPTGFTVTSTGTSSSSTVVNGGSTLAHLRASSPFQTVYVAVTDDPLDGYYKLTFTSATTDTFVVIQLGRTIPVNTFSTVFQIGNSGGGVSGTAAIANTVNTTATTGQVQVQASWDLNSDVDLHVVEPNGHEIWFGDLGPSATGGFQDVDSICGSNGNVENTRWTTNAPTGTYTVRLDYFSNCGVSATNYVVTVNNGGSTIVKTGSFTGTGNGGGLGSGVLITTFSHSSSSITTQDFSGGSAPLPLSPEALVKRAKLLP